MKLHVLTSRQVAPAFSIFIRNGCEQFHLIGGSQAPRHLRPDHLHVRLALAINASS